MTLVIAMSKPEGIYMSADYRITDSRSGRLVDDASVKFLTAKYPPHGVGPTVLFGYSGLAILPDGTPTGHWLRETLRGESEVIKASMEHLLERLNRDLAPVRQPLQITVHILESEKRFFGGFTNMRITGSSVVAAPRFEFQLREFPIRFWAAHGSGMTALSKADKELLKRQLRIRPSSPLDHMGLLAAVNRRTASRDSAVSPFCHVCYVNADDTTPPQDRVYTNPGEAPIPFSMPFLLFGLDVHDMMRDVVKTARARRKGETDPSGVWDDPAEMERSIRRRD